MRRRPNLSSILVVLSAVAVSIGLSGCWAPLVQVAEAVAEDSASVAGSVVESVHHDSNHALEDKHPGESDADRMERCNSLVLQAPSVIELRNSANGAPEYRELNLEGSFDAAKWTPVTGENTGAEGWQPAVNFLRMNFNPPLTDAIPKTGSCFLAYASTDVVNTADEDRINSMKANFNDESGTFEWNGRSYQYATSYALPCYRLP